MKSCRKHVRWHRVVLWAALALFSGHPGVAQVIPDPVAGVREKELSGVRLPAAPPGWYADVDVVFCKLDLHLEADTVFVEGNALTRCYPAVPDLGVYRCELAEALAVDSVLYNGNPALFIRLADTLSVVLDPLPATGTLFDIRVFYHGLPLTGGFFAGVTSLPSVQWGTRATWTLSQPYNAKQWWPCKQDLKDKFDSAWIFVTTDTANRAGSNGRLTGVTPLPGGKHRYEWKTRYPIDYYLVSVAVSDYQDYSIYAHPAGSADSILIQNYIYDVPGCLDHYRNDLDLTRNFLELFSVLFGPYPFAAEKYGHCQVELGGGMEHQTMGTLGAFNFHLNNHELAHQWFGDHVTCASWSDIWLNEGFATYAQYLALQYLTSQELADQFIFGVHEYVMSQPGGSVYIPETDLQDVGRIFDGRLSYNKGAAILHALRGEINNDSLFFLTLRNYLDLYGDSVATGEDFRQVAESTTGMDFSGFFDQWYYGEGYPLVDIQWSQQGDSLRIRTLQSASTAGTPFFAMSLDFRLLSDAGDTVVRVWISQPDLEFSVYAGRVVNGLVPDPFQWQILRIQSLNRVEEPDPEKGFTLYPNPAFGALHYLLTDPAFEGAAAVVTDRNGKRILETDLVPGTGTLGLGQAAPGVYFLKVSARGRTFTRTFVKI